MRRNKFGEAYCQTADEVRAELGAKGLGDNETSADYPDESEPSDVANGFGRFCAEVRENESGETVCYAEADTVDGVIALLEDTGVEYCG